MQLKSIHTRTRTHLVAECHGAIIKLYGINHLSEEEVKVEVNKLLEDDKFICRKATREVRTPEPSDVRR